LDTPWDGSGPHARGGRGSFLWFEVISDLKEAGEQDRGERKILSASPT
jgi:hypothetical protein